MAIVLGAPSLAVLTDLHAPLDANIMGLYTRGIVTYWASALTLFTILALGLAAGRVKKRGALGADEEVISVLVVLLPLVVLVATAVVVQQLVVP